MDHNAFFISKVFGRGLYRGFYWLLQSDTALEAMLVVSVRVLMVQGSKVAVIGKLSIPLIRSVPDAYSYIGMDTRGLTWNHEERVNT